MTTSTLIDFFPCGHATNSTGVRPRGGSRGAGQGWGATLGFVYASDSFADDYADIVEFLQRRTDIAHWVGTVGLGICASGREYLDEPALALLCCSFREDSFRVFSGLKAPRDAADARLQLDGAPASFAIVHADPATPSLTSLVRELAARTSNGFIVGGLTSSRGGAVQYADGLTDGGVSGVMFSDEVVLATRLTQGCTPVGPKHVITDARQNILVSLDGRPALDVFREDIGKELASNLGLVAGRVFAGIPVEGSDTGDYLVRNLVGLDTAHKLVAVGETVRPVAASCSADATAAPPAMISTACSRASTAGCFAHQECVFLLPGPRRQPFGENSEELRIIRDRLGDVPIVGFFCNGEISHNRLYSYTGVLTLFL
jgi:small ligand-binding sensory domain FIST